MSRALNLSNSRQQQQQQQQQLQPLQPVEHEPEHRQHQPAVDLPSADSDVANSFDFATTVPHYSCRCRWEINNWTSLPFVTGHYLDSPSFFADECPSVKWCLRFYPHGDCQQFRDWICVFVVLKEMDTETPFRPIISKAHFKMETAAAGGAGAAEPEQVVERRSESLSFAVHGTHGWSVVPRSEFQRVRHLNLQLTVHFSVPSQVTTFVRSGSRPSAAAAGMGADADEDLASLLMLLPPPPPPAPPSLPSLSPAAARQPGGCPAPPSAALSVHRHARLSADLRRSLLPGDLLSDVRLRLQCGAEFPAHRCLLAARSAVFRAMFTHNCLERDAASVGILDAEPASFGVFLAFLYTGEVSLGELEANGRELLKLADKYAVGELRALCVQALAREVSAATLYELAVLADTYRIGHLLDRCTQFMREHAEDVLASEEWRDLMQHKPGLAQQLLVQMTKRGA